METDQCPEAFTRAQDAWERVRAEFFFDAAVSSTSSPAVLAALWARFSGDEGRAVRIVSRDRCPLPVLLDAADSCRPIAVARAAAANPSFPRERVLDVFMSAANSGWLSHSLMHLPAAALEVVIGEIDLSPDPSAWATIPNAAAVANDGIVTRGASSLVREWLEGRSSRTLQRLSHTVSRLAGRADLTDEETLLCARMLAGQHDARSLIEFLAVHPVSFEAARVLLTERSPSVDVSVWRAAYPLLIGRFSVAEQVSLVKFVANDSPTMADALWRRLPDAGRLAALGCEPFSHLDQLVCPAMPMRPLCRRAFAPAELRELSLPQLELFEALAPGWKGRFAPLIDVIVRTA